LNPSALRNEFPIFTHHPKLVYLDSGATSQKPRAVIDAITNFYATTNANVHRGVYELSENATRLYEGARHKVAQFLGGVAPEEVIFTRGTTESINLVAYCLTERIRPGDEIVLTVAEHHSNIVPWQMLAQKTQAKLRYISLTPEFTLDLRVAQEIINKKTKVVAFAHVSNVLGCIHPVKQIAELARSVGALTVVDGAQGAPHLPLNMKELGCDFYTISGHKMLGPTGIGVLFGRRPLLESLPPYQGGGDMIEKVGFDASTWAGLPNKFEAGTPSIASAVGLGAAVDFLQALPSRLEILAHERDLGHKLLRELRKNRKVRPFTCGGEQWVGIVAFYHEQIHPHDLAAIADTHQVCIRAGHHCAQPLMSVFGVQATSRVSPLLYNSEDDIDAFLRVLHKAEQLFA
jgi:SufS family cysteine desulfurase